MKIPQLRIVLDPYKKVKVNRFEISEEEIKKVLEKLITGKSAGLCIWARNRAI